MEQIITRGARTRFLAYTIALTSLLSSTGVRPKLDESEVPTSLEKTKKFVGDLQKITLLSNLVMQHVKNEKLKKFTSPTLSIFNNGLGVTLDIINILERDPKLKLDRLEARFECMKKTDSELRKQKTELKKKKKGTSSLELSCPVAGCYDMNACTSLSFLDIQKLLAPFIYKFFGKIRADDQLQKGIFLTVTGVMKAVSERIGKTGEVEELEFDESTPKTKLGKFGKKFGTPTAMLGTLEEAQIWFVQAFHAVSEVLLYAAPIIAGTDVLDYMDISEDQRDKIMSGGINEEETLDLSSYQLSDKDFEDSEEED
ncbi:MAG: hypothetical protein M1549_00400 [Candidatus Dependentiae bacterium]|jgi:hypothetical protein|nr:hypothetical protein [Candidatus Dependentiae bacterium]